MKFRCKTIPLLSSRPQRRTLCTTELSSRPQRRRSKRSGGTSCFPRATTLKGSMTTNSFRLCRTALLLILLSSLAVAQTPSAAPPLPADIPATAERYSLLLMDTLAGQQAVWTASDGTLHIFFQFNDRGRGPKTTSILKLDANGIPVSETVTGNDYLKSPVNENYSLESGTARWKNTAEQGEKKISGPAFYSALNGGPSEIALLAQDR